VQISDIAIFGIFDSNYNYKALGTDSVFFE